MNNFSGLRDKWYSAYVEGNTFLLKSYESPELTVTINGELEMGDRYSEIEAKVNSGAWFQPKLERQEKYNKTDDGYVVDGVARIIEGKLVGKELTYSEFWRNEGGSYRITQLSINA